MDQIGNKLYRIVEILEEQMINGRPDYPYVDDELRKVARDAYVVWRGSRYSVPWEYAGKKCGCANAARRSKYATGAERIAAHVEFQSGGAGIVNARHAVFFY